MKKRYVAIALASVLAFTMLAGCGNSSSDTAAEAEEEEEEVAEAEEEEAEEEEAVAVENDGTVYKLTVGGCCTEDHPITQALYKFKEICEEESGGQIEVEVYPNSQLGSNRELVESVQHGDTSICEVGAVVLASFTDKFKFTSLPYLFDSSEAAINFINYTDVGQQLILDVAEETGVYALWFDENGWQTMTSNVPIHTPDDLSGIKLRTQENDLLLELYAEMGANPMSMAYTELFTALQQGTCDASVNPPLIIQTGNFYEVQEYITDVNAVYDYDIVGIDYNLYKSLPDDLREIVDNAAAESRDFSLQGSRDADAEAVAILEENNTVYYLTDDERQQFVDATAGVYDWFRENIDEPNLDLYLDAIAECNEKYAQGQLEEVTGKDLQ